MSFCEKNIKLEKGLTSIYATVPFTWNNVFSLTVTFGYMMKSVAVIILAVALTGCAKQSFDFNKEASSTTVKNETHHFFISGLGQEKIINAAAVCGGADKVSRTETKLTFMNGFLNVITFGIYTPREATVYCEK